jgi:hypothetical protein
MSSNHKDLWVRYLVSSMVTYAILMTIYKDIKLSLIGIVINSIWHLLVIALSWGRRKQAAREVVRLSAEVLPSTRRMASILTIIEACPVTNYEHRTYEWVGDKHLTAWIELSDLPYLPWPVVEDPLPATPLVDGPPMSEHLNSAFVRIRRKDVPGYQLYRLRRLGAWVVKNYKEFETRLILTLCVWGIATYVPHERPHWGWLKHES